MASAEKIAERVVQRINRKYDVDDAFVEQIRQFVIEETCNHRIIDQDRGTDDEADPHDDHAVAAGGGARPAAKKKQDAVAPKKMKPYNAFMKAKMPEMADVPHKERMGKIAALWAALPAAEKAKY